MKKIKIFLVGGMSLSMFFVKSFLLKQNDACICDNGLFCGDAKLSSYTNVLFDQQYRQAEFYGLDLNDDLGLPKYINYTSISEKCGVPLISQVCALFGFSPNRHELMAGYYDLGGITAMLVNGADWEEIIKVVKQSQRIFGVSEPKIDKYIFALNKAKTDFPVGVKVRYNRLLLGDDGLERNEQGVGYVVGYEISYAFVKLVIKVHTNVTRKMAYYDLDESCEVVGRIFLA